jgi:hypothetical protein
MLINNDSEVQVMDKEQLKRWLIESGRKYILINGLHFIDALSIEELELFQQLLVKYEEHRKTIPTGHNITEYNKFTGANYTVKEVHTSLLSEDELKEVGKLILLNTVK